MEKTDCSQIFVNTYETTQLYDSEYHNINIQNGLGNTFLNIHKYSQFFIPCQKSFVRIRVKIVSICFSCRCTDIGTFYFALNHRKV